MTLKELSTEAARVTGSGLGFVVKSLKHPERKFLVGFEFKSGKYGITRLDTGDDYIVEGGSDRYEFAVNMARLREVKMEMTELNDQKTLIETRLAELTGELDGVTGAGLVG